MKTSVLLLAMSAGMLAQAQDRPALQLWAEAGRQGYLTQAYAAECVVEELPFTLMGKVSSLEIAPGYSATFFRREELQGPVSLEVHGPCRIDDLEAVPMMTFRGNWDDAIGSMRIERITGRELIDQPPVVAELDP